MTVYEYLKVTFDANDIHQVRDRVCCKDGWSVSIQGGDSFHYCCPRDKVNTYESVELGYPSAPETALLAYAEDPDRPTKTVYGYVPLKLVENIIAAHGGIDVDATFV